jgi:transcriptional regulator with XRE-family HTH domain
LLDNPPSVYVTRVITPAQVRAGRAALRLKQIDLAKAAGVSLQALKNFEQEVTDPRKSTIDALERVLVELGVEFEIDPSGKQTISWSGESVPRRP